MENVVNDIQSYLSQQSICVPTEWLDACIQWIQEEFQGRPCASQMLRQQVYEQWLCSDLTELALAALPLEVFNEKYLLSGTYCLQINSAIDTSQPCYSQLLEIQGKDRPDTRVTAETQPTQRVSASRVLMLEMSDGVSTVSGLEYRPIGFLKLDVTPGSKIRIKGPVLCRKGVLLLSSKNVELLGGEAESLFANTPENVLLKALNRPLRTDSGRPTHQQVVTTEETTPSSGGDVFVAGDVIDDVMDQLPTDVIEQLTEMDDFDDDFSAPTSSAARPGSDVTGGTSRHDVIGSSHVTRTRSGKDNLRQSAANREPRSDREDGASGTSSTVAVASSPAQQRVADCEADDLTSRSARVVYLCDVKRQLQQKGFTGRCVVKGFVVTLLSKLRRTEGGHEWGVDARICDGTDVLDIRYSDRVLTQLIGFTAQQADAIRSEGDGQMASRLRAGMTRCRDHVVDECRLLEVDFSQHHQLPVITALVLAPAPHWPHFPT